MQYIMDVLLLSLLLHTYMQDLINYGNYCPETLLHYTLHMYRILICQVETCSSRCCRINQATEHSLEKGNERLMLMLCAGVGSHL